MPYHDKNNVQDALKKAQALSTHKGLTPAQARQADKVKRSIIKRLKSIDYKQAKGYKGT